MNSGSHTTRREAQPKYSGAGGLAVRPLTAADLTAAMRLKKLAGWNQTDADWRVFLDASKAGCFAVVSDNQVVGTSATIRYEDEIAWIGMVLVDPEIRRMGIGKTLLQAALESVRDVPLVKLDATPEGKQLYDTLGFRDESTLQRYICPSVPELSLEHSHEHCQVRPMTPENLDAVVALDCSSFGARREELLETLFANSPQTAFCLEQDGQVAGFCLGRAGTTFFQIGPVVAPNDDAAQKLVAAALKMLPSCSVGVDVFDSRVKLRQWLRDIGFVSQRPFIRMVRGERTAMVAAGDCCVICGPEFG